MKIELMDQPTAEDIGFIRDALVINNQTFVGEVRRQPLLLFAFNELNEKVGGISGVTYGKWLSIDYLWVREDVRTLRMGSQLLLSIEQQAIKRGCQYAQVDTFSFQARPFYEKHGYQVGWVLQHYPVDHEKYYLTKQLDQTA